MLGWGGRGRLQQYEGKKQASDALLRHSICNTAHSIGRNRNGNTVRVLGTKLASTLYCFFKIDCHIFFTFNNEYKKYIKENLDLREEKFRKCS
jgi:hypothetical protein